MKRSRNCNAPGLLLNRALLRNEANASVHQELHQTSGVPKLWAQLGTDVGR